MFIAHLPAGYVATKKLQDKMKVYKFLWVGLVASVLPDIDLLWFYFVDHRQHNHHDYLTHSPFFWLIILVGTLLILFLIKKLNRTTLSVVVFFFANLYLHFILDTFVGGINWGYPFFNKEIFLYEITPQYHPWFLNFILHPSFILEIAIIIYGLIYYYLRKRNMLINKNK
jgi:inner membrane protein